METLKKYMYEGLLQGMDKTIQAGDDMIAKANAELSIIKTYTDHSNHKIWQSSKYGWEGRRYNTGFGARSLAVALGYWDKIDTLRIIVTKDGDTDYWIIDVTFYNNGFRMASGDSKHWEKASFSVMSSVVKTFPTLLKRYVAPIFENLETLKKFMKANKVQ